MIQADDAAFGTDAVVRGTPHGRDHLRLDFTSFHSYNAVLAQLGSGGLFSEWNIASKADLETLDDAAGIAHGSTDPVQLTLVDQLRDWFCFSCVNTSPSNVYARGLVSDVLTMFVSFPPNPPTEIVVQEVFTIPTQSTIA